MDSKVSLSPIEDCQLYQKRILFKEENGEVKQVRIITHKKEDKSKSKSNRKDKWCKLCGSKMN